VIKVKVMVEYELDLPITHKDAKTVYPDAEYPIDCHALDYISENSLTELVKSSKPSVSGVSIRDQIF